MTDVLELLRDWEPPEAARDPDAAGRARARLHAHIDAAPSAAALPRSGRRPWWPVIAVAAAVAVGVVFLSLGSRAQDRGVAPPPATAGDVLEYAARAAEQEPESAPFPAPDEFAYVRSQGGNLSCVYDGGPEDWFCAYVVQRRELWQSFSRKGRLRDTVIASRWPTAGQRQRWIRAGRPPVVGREPGQPTVDSLPRSHFMLANRRLTYLEVLAYRPTPEALYRRLVASRQPGQGASLEAEVWTFVADALRDQPVPAPLRAALYRVLKLVPGTRLGGVVRDRLGRRALVVARTAHGVRQELLFDPVSWDLLGERRVTARAGVAEIPDAPAGTVLGDVVYEQRGVVDRVGVRPPR